MGLGTLIGRALGGGADVAVRGAAGTASMASSAAQGIGRFGAYAAEGAIGAAAATAGTVAAPALATKAAFTGRAGRLFEGGAGQMLGAATGFGAGSAVGAIKGAAMGAAFGPVGTVVGAGAGAYAGMGAGSMAGSLLGKAVGAAPGAIKGALGSAKAGLKGFGSDVAKGFNEAFDPGGFSKMNINVTSRDVMGGVSTKTKMASNSSVTGGMANPPGGSPTPGNPATAANAAIGSNNYSGPFTGALAAASPMAIGLGMGVIGGMTSYATGGNFMQGAALGAAGGFVGVKGAMYGAKYAGKNMEPGMMRDAANSARSFFLGGGLGRGSQGVANQRAAMLAGAGLSGMVFGGRRNHKRGFNSRRGNSF